MSLQHEYLGLSITDVSGICGSISIACWLVVFLPQLVENFRRRSTEGLSVRFVSIWLSGDVCNVLGSILQGVLPTMMILAVYYALVDILLLGQIFYYRGFTWSEEIASNGPNESSRLLTADSLVVVEQGATAHLSAAHLSPTVQLFVPKTDDIITPRAITHNTWRKLVAVALVIIIGVLGWFFARSSAPKTTSPSPITFNPWGQTFGYICAVLYLSSRLPQLLLNYRRKSTEGMSLLFFIFACIANLTYVLSILVYEPFCESQNGTGYHCKPGELRKNYWRHIAVNTSWIIGSAGTYLLDFCIFIQFSLYKNSVMS